MWKEPDEIVDETDLMWRETSNRFRAWMKNQRNYICPEKNIPSSRGLQCHLDEDTAATQRRREKRSAALMDTKTTVVNLLNSRPRGIPQSAIRKSVSRCTTVKTPHKHLRSATQFRSCSYNDSSHKTI
jgi:hypothetical protein